MLLAVMDLGSNSFKMTVAQWAPELNRRQPFRVLHKERHPIQLGKSVFESGKISPKDFKDGLKAIFKMQARLRDFSSPILRVVATSAIRDSANGREFVKEVRAQLGIPIEVISGTEEAKLIARGLEWEYPRVQKGLLIDIGGGSTEIAAFGKAWDSTFCHSLKMGSIRLQTVMPRIKSAQDLLRTRKVVKNLLRQEAPLGMEKLIGSAGAIQSLGKILGNKRPLSIIKKADLDLWIDNSIGMSAKDFVEAYDLAPSRARIVLPGAIILSEILAWLGRKECNVTDMTLRDGLLVDLVGNWQLSENQILHKTTLTRSSSIKNVGDKRFLKHLEERAQHYNLDLAHARHVATLATSLFDQLKSAGARFSDEERKYLLVASYLHDVGKIISVDRHHHHSAYIIRHTQFPELTQLENKKCALIALFHRKEEPGKKSSLPWGISGIHADQVRRMTALLRLADGLDEDHTQNIDSLAIKVRKKQALLELVQMRPDPLNLGYFKEKAGYFEELFGVKIISFVHPRRLGRGQGSLN